MADSIQPGARISRPPTFDPALWLDAFTTIGGIYVLGSDRTLAFKVADCDASDLAEAMRPLMGEPERIEAIRRAIEARQGTEVWHG